MIPDQLHPDLLLRAYRLGMFPMTVPGGAVHWYSPDPRAIIELSGFKIARSLRRKLHKADYEIRMDTSFECVIRHCADRQEGTWISDELVDSYTRLHQAGYAHSVETYYGDELAGGLYGVSIAGAFFGESMFTLISGGSKLALCALVQHMKQRGMELLDTQFLTPHLVSFGAIEIPRTEYLCRLTAALASNASFVCDQPE